MSMKIRVGRWMALLYCAALLLGCGFSLRNANELPPTLQHLYLKTEEPFGRFETTLRATLRSSGVQLVTSPDQAPVTLAVSKPELSYSGSTVGTSNQSRVYSVVYAVAVSLLTPDGKVLWGPKMLRSLRNLTLSANQMIESNNQLSLLEQDMQRDVITQLYNRLGSEQVAQLWQTQK